MDDNTLQQLLDFVMANFNFTYSPLMSDQAEKMRIKTYFGSIYASFNKRFNILKLNMALRPSLSSGSSETLK